jgi:hypothetical protein
MPRMRAGCQCLREWNYTSSKGNLFHVSSGCANPDGDQPTAWCMVDPATCSHEPIASPGGGFWDQCYAAGDSVTIDTGAAPVLAAATAYLAHRWLLPAFACAACASLQSAMHERASLDVTCQSAAWADMHMHASLGFCMQGGGVG